MAVCISSSLSASHAILASSASCCRCDRFLCVSLHTLLSFGSCSSYIIQNSEAKQLSCVCFVKQSSSRLPSLKCHNMAHPGKYFSDRFLLLEDLRWNTLVWQQMKGGVYILHIHKLSGSRWKR